MTDTHLPALPIIRLRHDKPLKRLLQGHPWVFADDLVMDRRARGREPGEIVELQSHARASLGLAAFNPLSKIAIRRLDTDATARIDTAWFAAKIARALALRERLYDAPFYRLIHAEADGLPGVIVDRFGDVAVVQPNAAWAERYLSALTEALCAVTRVISVYKNASGRARKLEGLDEESGFLCGQIEGLIDVPMNGAIYKADLLGGQKTGLFFDQRDNHAFAARLGRGGAVLDVFSHVGGFALAALAGGAATAVAVDASAPALDLAARGAAASGVADQLKTRQGDAFVQMKQLYEEGAQFDLVVCDPPAFAPHKEALQAGLRAYEKTARMGAQLVKPGGFLVLCSCSHAADLEKFMGSSLAGVGKAGRRAQLLRIGGAGPDHPSHVALAETGYLKAIFLRLDV